MPALEESGSDGNQVTHERILLWMINSRITRMRLMTPSSVAESASKGEVSVGPDRPLSIAHHVDLRNGQGQS